MNSQKFRRRILYPILGLAALLGTCRSNSGVPFIYNVKSGHDVGLNIGLITKFNPGSSLHGANFSLYNFNNGAKIVGANIAVIANQYEGPERKITIGLEASLLVNAPGVFGRDVAATVHGLQVAFFANSTLEDGRNVQIGLYNETRSKDGKLVEWNPIINQNLIEYNN